MTSRDRMKRQFYVLTGTWMSDSLLLAGAVYYATQFPGPLILRFVLPSVMIGFSVGVFIAWSRFRMYGTAKPGHLMSMTVLWALATCVTLGAVHDIPQLTDWRTVYAVHLEPFYYLVLLGVSAYLVFWSLVTRPGWAKAEMGIITILVFSAANGYLFHLHGERFALILGLSLATVSLVLREHPAGGATLRLPKTTVPVLLFLGWGLVATLFSPYVNASLTVWIRLANWILVFFLITWIARGQSQQERLVGVMLGLGMVIAVAGLVGIAGYAERMGLLNAVRTRLFVRELHANGVGALLAACVTLLLGMWSQWRSLPRRMLLTAALLLMLLCGLFTYSRGAAFGLFAGFMTLLILRWKSRAITSRRSLIVMIAVATIPLLFIAVSSAVRITEGEYASRIEIWKVVFDVTQKRPLTGVGLGNHLIPYYVQTSGAERPWIYRDILSMVRQVGWHSHNLLLEITEALGFVGLVLFLVLIIRGWVLVRSVMRGYGSRSPILLQATAAAVVSLLASHMIGLSLSAFTLLPACFWILWALLVAAGQAAGTDSTAGTSTGSGDSASGHRMGLVLAMLCLSTTALFVVRPLVVESLLRSTKDESRKRDRTHALPVIKAAARLDPLRAEIPAILGSLSTASRAGTLYQRASELRPFYAPYHAKLGWLYWVNNEFDRAVISFHWAAALDRYGLDGGEHWSDLALAYAAAGRKAEAVDAFCEAVLLDPRSLTPPCWQRSGGDILLDAVYTRFHKTGIVDSALRSRLVRHAGLAVGRSETFPFVPGSPFHLREVMDRLRERVAVSADPEQKRGILFSMAGTLLQWRLYSDLDGVFDQLTPLAGDHAPSQAKLLMIKGTALRARGKLAEAEDAFADAVTYLDHPRLHHQLGMTYIHNGKQAAGLRELEKAAKSFDPSLLFDPSWMHYWKDLADAYRDARRLDDAVAAYDVAQFLSFPVPAYVTSCLQVARAYREKGNYAGEIDVYRNALRILSRWGRSGESLSAPLRRVAREIVVSHRHQHISASESYTLTRQLVESFPDLEEHLLRYVAELRRQSVNEPDE